MRAGAVSGWLTVEERAALERAALRAACAAHLGDLRRAYGPRGEGLGDEDMQFALADAQRRARQQARDGGAGGVA